jgi:Putative transposase/Transposase zinc-binding domain
VNGPARLQTVLDTYLTDYPHAMDGHRLAVCRHIVNCRSEAMGQAQYHCDECGHEQVRALACRDRHCPQCQYQATLAWRERETRQLVPSTYYHLVFTLPHDLNGWVALHPRLMYHLVFAAVWHTLRTFAADPKRLGGQLGAVMVLHTWGQNLSRHVHIHCLIPGGVIEADGRFKTVKGNTLFPVKALSRHYRGSLVSRLRQAADAQQLYRVTRPGEVDQMLNTLMSKDWAVYAKACLGRTEQVVDYLSRYTHRIAISDHRIRRIADGRVTFDYKDYAHRGKSKQMSLPAETFIGRFLLHVLPKGFMRVRHYGYLANCCRENKLALIRRSLAAEAMSATELAVEACSMGTPKTSLVYRCPKCKLGRMNLVCRLSRPRLEGG